jgi:hypothetical protein
MLEQVGAPVVPDAPDEVLWYLQFEFGQNLPAAGGPCEERDGKKAGADLASDRIRFRNRWVGVGRSR